MPATIAEYCGAYERSVPMRIERDDSVLVFFDGKLVYDKRLVYLYELDPDEPLSVHFDIAERCEWPFLERRRIYVVEGVGERGEDGGYDAPDNFVT
jgi:hypothetical protein